MASLSPIFGSSKETAFGASSVKADPEMKDEQSSQTSRDPANVSELLDMLQKEYANNKQAALQAEQDAAQARNNARHAQEVARRYKHRTYSPSPLVKTSTFSITSSNVATASNEKNNSKATSKSLAKPPSSGNNRLLSKPLSSDYAAAENSSASHAEDVLSLSLEVSQLQAQLKDERESHEKEIAELKRKLEQAKSEAAAAEEDATLGLDLAKQAHEQRDYLLENVLPPLREELEFYKQQVAGLGSGGEQQQPYILQAQPPSGSDPVPLTVVPSPKVLQSQTENKINAEDIDTLGAVASSHEDTYGGGSKLTDDGLEEEDDGSLTTYDNHTTDTVGGREELDTLDGNTTLDSRRMNSIVKGIANKVGVDSAPPSPGSLRSKEKLFDMTERQLKTGKAPAPPRVSKAMVAVGRNLFSEKQQDLRRKQQGLNEQPEEGFVNTFSRKSAQYYTIHLQQLAAKRQALWDRLKSHDQRQQSQFGRAMSGAEGTISEATPRKVGPMGNQPMSPLTPYDSNQGVLSPDPSSNNSIASRSKTAASATTGKGMYLTSASCDSLLKLLRQSSAKMELNVRYFSVVMGHHHNYQGMQKMSSPGSASSASAASVLSLTVSPAQIEQVATEFCQAVEEKVQRLTTECQQLEALCVYLERKHIPSESSQTRGTTSDLQSNGDHSFVFDISRTVAPLAK